EYADGREDLASLHEAVLRLLAHAARGLPATGGARRAPGMWRYASAARRAAVLERPVVCRKRAAWHGAGRTTPGAADRPADQRADRCARAAGGSAPAAAAAAAGSSASRPRATSAAPGPAGRADSAAAPGRAARPTQATGHDCAGPVETAGADAGAKTHAQTAL